jgi:hypothetical protein
MVTRCKIVFENFLGMSRTLRSLRLQECEIKFSMPLKKGGCCRECCDDGSSSLWQKDNEEDAAILPRRNLNRKFRSKSELAAARALRKKNLAIIIWPEMTKNIPLHSPHLDWPRAWVWTNSPDGRSGKEVSSTKSGIREIHIWKTENY